MDQKKKKVNPRLSGAISDNFKEVKKKVTQKRRNSVYFVKTIAFIQYLTSACKK